MSVLSNIKPNVKKRLALTKANLLFKKEQILQKDFFKVPSRLELLKIAGVVLLDQLLKKLLYTPKSKIEMKSFLQNDPIAKTILKTTLEDLKQDELSILVLECYDGNFTEKLLTLDDEISGEQLLNYVDNISDIDLKFDNKKSKILLNKIKGQINKIQKTKKNNIDVLNRTISEYGGSILLATALIETTKNGIKEELYQLNQEKEKVQARISSYVNLVQYDIQLAKELLTKTDHPPKYRVKYIQKLTRQIYGILKTEYNEVSGNIKKEISSLLDILKQIDNIIIAVAMITGIYITNRKNLQKKSSETLKNISSDITCTDFSSKENSLEPFDVSVNHQPFEVTLNCPVKTDNIIVAHTPISEKIKNFSCEIPRVEDKEVEITESIDFITHAVIRNKSKNVIEYNITKDSHLTTEQQIGRINNSPIYCPVNGTVDTIDENEIILRDISDAEENFLSVQINLLSEKYERLNSVKSFLKNYYVESLYPLMLSVATIDDASTRDTQTGVEKKWKDFKQIHNLINKEYEKQVEKITGKDNVETHAKNETLDIIKKELDKQEEIFYKHLELIHSSAENTAKKTKAKSNEYELIEYYSLNLGALLNQLDATDKIETEFKDKINEFIRRRVIVDGYKKTKIADKINDQIKDIEKGISAGNWFNKAMELYLYTKKLDEVKNWLNGLANKNKKLEGSEKIYAVNRVMFLFELYLNYDEIVKKYNIIKKETTSKKETIKEGQWIYLFTEQLWKDYKQLPLQIEEIQKTIDSLSMFQTYSIINWNGYQARLYTIADKPTCEWNESDPYINAVSKYGFGDIQYWLRYCAFATLASCSNPATGWSTGWIFPTPILFPVVYLPIKSIYTKYGFMVIGLSICGIYLFPWVLFVNLTTGYTTPFGDPTVLIKKQIEALKKSIAEQLLKLKGEIIKPLLDKTLEDIEKREKEIDDLKSEQKEYIQSKPQRLSADLENVNNGIKENLNYVNDYFNWIEKNKNVAEKITTSQIKLWEKQKMAMILQEAYTYGSDIKGMVSADEMIGKIQLLLGKQIDKLIAMLSEIDNIVAVLPIALAPETANFAMTIKNPKPIIKIKDNLEEMIDAVALDSVVEKFRLKSEDLTSSKYLNKLIFSVVNDKVYRRALSAARVKIIIQDAFPHYESLSSTNYPWIMFLYKDFVTTGSRTYGFPGFPPIPI